MTEWLLILPPLTLLFGACAAMVSHALHPPLQGRVAMRIAIFSIGMAALQISILGFRAYGLSPSGLFRIDGLSLSLSLSAMFAVLVSLVSFYLKPTKGWPFVSVGALVLSTATVLGLFSNEVLLFFFAASTLLIFIRWPNQIWSVSPQNEAGDLDVLGIVGWFVFGGIAATVLVQSAGTGRMDLIHESVWSATAANSFHIGVIGVLAVLVMGISPAPLQAYGKKASELGHWAGVAFAKVVLPALLMLLVIRWVWIFALDEKLESTIHVEMSLVFGALLAAILASTAWSFWTKREALHTLSSLGLSSIALCFVPFFLKDPEILSVGFAHFWLGLSLTALVFSAISEADVSTRATFADLKDALVMAPLRIQLAIFLGILGLAVPFGVSGFTILDALLAQAVSELSAHSTLASLLLVLISTNAICFFHKLTYLMRLDAKRQLVWDGGQTVQKTWSYCLAALVLILGVHPQPLYNYFAHSIKLILKNH